MPNVKMSDRGIKMLTGFEAMILTVYRDVVGIETVCVGHVVLPGDKTWIDDGITREDCENALSRDLSRFETAIGNAVRVNLSQPMVDALVSLVFNIGTGAFLSSTVLRLLNQENYVGAADAFLMWKNAKVKQKDGSYISKPVLLGRRQSESNLFRSGISDLTLPEPPLVDLVTTAQKAFAALFELRSLLDDRGLPVVDSDVRNEQGLISCLPPDAEIAAA